MKRDIVKFYINNWEPDCPETCQGIDIFSKECFVTEYIHIFGDSFYEFKFTDDDWCREQKICVLNDIADQSTDSFVVAPREWVEKNWPEIINSEWDYTNKPSPFLSHPRLTNPEDIWLDYCEDNFGCDWLFNRFKKV